MLKGTILAQNNLQKSELRPRQIKLLVEMKENKIVPFSLGSLICPLGESMIYCKKQTEKIEKVTKPVCQSRQNIRPSCLSNTLTKSSPSSTTL